MNKTITKNGATAKNVAVAGGLVLTDNDLCGIFSGKITDWSGVTNFAKDKVTAGGISVVYRSDGSGQSFTLPQPSLRRLHEQQLEFPAAAQRVAHLRRRLPASRRIEPCDLSGSCELRGPEIHHGRCQLPVQHAAARHGRQ